MAIPVDVRDLMKSSARLVEERERPVHVTVFVEIDAPDALIEAVREALRPRSSGARLQVEVVEPGRTYSVALGTDLVIVVGGSGSAALRDAIAEPRHMRIPVVVLGLGDAYRAAAIADALLQPSGDTIVRPEPEPVLEQLGQWLGDNLGSKRLALAHNFAFVRRAVAEEAVKTTAWQNALIGTVTPIPGADMPIMTANQAKMLLQIAAAYGQPLGVDRIKELAAVVGSGLLLRAVARQALLVVPVLGWAVKGGIAYTGTLAMGKTAISYFEEDADIGKVTARLKGLAESAARTLPGKRPKFGSRRAPVALPAPGVTMPLPGVTPELALPTVTPEPALPPGDWTAESAPPSAGQTGAPVPADGTGA